MRILVLAATIAACDPYDVCDVIADPPLPEMLSATGLDAPGVEPYTPAFALWSDGAEKRRWLYLPPGTDIDTSDPDDWQFPIGTKAWKEFTRDGVRVETRLIQRLDDGSWAGVAYRWEGDDARAIPAGADDANGTPHDIPDAGHCVACHGGRKSFVLGVSAIQRGLAPVPGDATARAALGYLHANCSHCHNQTRPAPTGARCYDPDNDVDFFLRVGALATPESTATYRTMRDRHDRIIELVSRRGSDLHMPPLATEQVDVEGVAAIRTWIDEL